MPNLLERMLDTLHHEGAMGDPMLRSRIQELSLADAHEGNDPARGSCVPMGQVRTWSR